MSNRTIETPIEDPTMTEPTLSPSLSDLLRSIVDIEDQDSFFLFAGAFNLYYDSIRRRGNRTVIGPEDVEKIFSICRILLSASEIEAGVAAFVRKGSQRVQ